MRTFLSMLLLTLLAGETTAQSSSCLKLVTFDVQQSVRYGLLPEVDIEELESIDLLHARPYDTRYQEKHCLDEKGQLITDMRFDNPAFHGDAWATSIYRITTDQNGVSLYDYYGQKVHTQYNTDLGLDQPVGLDMTQAESFGWYAPIYTLSLAEQQESEDLGYTVLNFEDGTQLISGSDKEIYIDPDNQVIEERHFDGGTLILWSVEKRAAVDAERAIPVYSIERIYESLSDGNKMEKATYRQYANYRIDDVTVQIPASALHVLQTEKDAINDYLEKSSTDGIISGSFKKRDLEQYISMSIWPNPANLHCKVELPNFPNIAQLSLRVVDLIGNTIYAADNLTNGGTHILDVNDWQPGMYFVKAGTGKVWIQERLIKQ